MNKGKRRILPRSMASTAAAVLLAVFLLLPDDTTAGAAQGVRMCLEAAVPSLFPMMFATVFAVEAGFARKVGEKLSGVSRFLFGMPGASGAAVLMAVMGGFPAGAKAVSGLYREGSVSRSDAKRLLLFCFSAGPAFLTGYVGGLYKSGSIGAAMLMIQIISVISVGLLTRLLPVSVCEERELLKRKEYSEKNISDAMTASAWQTAAAMLNICLFIIIFSIFRSVLDGCGFSGWLVRVLSSAGIGTAAAESVLPILLEVTAGCASAVRVGLPAAAFSVGFGGLAVHMQVMAASGELAPDYPVFLLMRVAQGVICACLAQVYLLVFPGGAVAASGVAGSVSVASTTPVGAVLLVVMSLMLVYCLPGENVRDMP